MVLNFCFPDVLAECIFVHNSHHVSVSFVGFVHSEYYFFLNVIRHIFWFMVVTTAV